MGPVLQIAEYTVDLPGCNRNPMEEKSTWPTTWFAPNRWKGAFKDVYSVMNNWGANHDLIYGHVESIYYLGINAREFLSPCTMFLKKEFTDLVHGAHLVPLI